MSYIRKNETRRYFDGESNIYVYPSDNSVVHRGPSMDMEDFGELILRGLERTDVDEEVFDEVVEDVVEHYQTEEDFVQGMFE